MKNIRIPCERCRGVGCMSSPNLPVLPVEGSLQQRFRTIPAESQGKCA
jgi:hypothetical protein